MWEKTRQTTRVQSLLVFRVWEDDAQFIMGPLLDHDIIFMSEDIHAVGAPGDADSVQAGSKVGQ